MWMSEADLRSCEANRVRRLLMTMSECWSLAATVKVDCYIMELGRHHDMLERLRDVVSMQSTENNIDASSMHRCRLHQSSYRISRVTGVDSAVTELDERDLHVFTELVSCDIGIVDLPCLRIESLPADATMLITALQQLLRSDDGFPSVSRVHVKAFDSSVPMLMSALSRSSKMFQVSASCPGPGDTNIGIHERKLRLQWLAFTLFCKEPTRNISQVSLSRFRLDENDVESMRSVVESVDPLTVCSSLDVIRYWNSGVTV